MTDGGYCETASSDAALVNVDLYNFFYKKGNHTGLEVEDEKNALNTN